MSPATVVVQARMGSTRLPGKSMATLGDRTVLDWVVERAGSAAGVGGVIVATSTNAEDDAIADHLAGSPVDVVRGDPHDVLARYARALETTDATYIVRVTGDCPFVQPALIDQALRTVEGIDYVATAADGRFPRGFDVEAIHRDALAAADAEATAPAEREHVTPFIVWHPERFASRPLECPPWARHPELRLTLDEPADLDLLRAVVHQLRATPATLRGEDVVELLLGRPDLVAINRHVEHNIVY